MNTLIQDIKYAIRVLMKARGFTAIAVLTLALGIGANTAIFSVVNGVLLNPLPYPHPEQVVSLSSRTSDFPQGSISYPNFRDWVAQNQAFSALAAYRQASFSLLGQGEPERVSAMMVSSSFFPVLGVKLAAGRNFSSAEDALNGAPAVILSNGFWQRKFGASPGVIGKALNLNGVDYSVAGVLPANFYFCCGNINFRLSDVYVPIGASSDPWMKDRRIDPGIRAIGRMKPGVSLAQAQADMDRVAHNLEAAYPDADKGVGIGIVPLKEVMIRNIRPFLLVLLAAVGFVLLIACVNVANLLLARSTGRAKEFAIRAALGATQGRVLRQLLTESVLLAAIGGGLGLLLASWGTTAVLAALPQALPRANDVRVDSNVLFFTLLISFVAGVLFGLAPAMKTSRPDLHDTLKEGGRGASGARYRMQGIFVVVEMALAVLLLIGAGLTIRSLMELWNVDPGFNSHNVVSFGVTFAPSVANGGSAVVRAALRDLDRKLAGIPGITAVSQMDGAFPLTGDSELPFWLEGQPKPANQNAMPSALWYIVSSDYLKVMRVPLLRGRFLTPQDDENAPGVCVIDESFARKFFPHEDPIGKRINFGLVYDHLQIVGVVGHVKQFGLDEGANPPVQGQFYTPELQLPDVGMGAVHGTDLVARTQSNPAAFVSSIRRAVEDWNSQAVVYGIETADGMISRSLASRRFAMILLAAFAAVALLLSSIGIYGVISYVAGQRTHEIGIRLALGAQRRDILRLVLGQGTRLALIGVAVGVAAALGLTQLMSSLLYGVSPMDPLTFAAVAALLTGVAVMACYIPARRAMRVDPIVALRYE